MSLLILLPPSEGKQEGGNPRRAFLKEHPDLAGDLRPVLKHLAELPKSSRAAFYGVSTPEKAEAAHALNLSALESPALPAIERYTGVVYDFLDYASLPDRAYARKHVMMVSGFFGLIPAGAWIPDYKLPMNPWLSSYWRPINAERLAGVRKRHKVLSLLPAAHARALGAEPDFFVDFRQEGGKRAAGHFGKAIKGKFLRFLMENRVSQFSEISDFSADGYTFDGKNFIQA